MLLPVGLARHGPRSAEDRASPPHAPPSAPLRSPTRIHQLLRPLRGVGCSWTLWTLLAQLPPLTLGTGRPQGWRLWSRTMAANRPNVPYRIQGPPGTALWSVLPSFRLAAPRRF